MIHWFVQQQLRYPNGDALLGDIYVMLLWWNPASKVKLLKTNLVCVIVSGPQFPVSGTLWTNFLQDRQERTVNYCKHVYEQLGNSYNCFLIAVCGVVTVKCAVRGGRSDLRCFFLPPCRQLRVFYLIHKHCELIFILNHKSPSNSAVTNIFQIVAHCNIWKLLVAHIQR